MTTCPECESELDIDTEEAEEGDIVACDECGTEFEVVGVDPLELSRMDEDEDEEDEDEPYDRDEDEEEED